MLPEHVVDVAVLPPGAPADDIVATNVRPSELAKLLPPLPLQPDAAARCVVRQVPLVQREHLPPPADEVLQLGALRYRRDDVARCRDVPPVGQVPRRQDEDPVRPQHPRLGLGEVGRAGEAAASTAAGVRHREGKLRSGGRWEEVWRREEEESSGKWWAAWRGLAFKAEAGTSAH
jgi:hypothetical protein